MAALAFLIQWPWLAVIPAILFLLLFHFSRRRLAAVVGVAWLVYALYEFAMYSRLLCSGECNIRIDLLAIHPALVLLTIIGGMVTLVGILRRSGAQ